jgi:hypothetical protein
VESLKGIALDLDMNFRTDYSGHGMYYKTCVGVVGGLPQVIKFVKAVAEWLQDNDSYADTDDYRDVETFYDMFIENLSSDSMARSTIWYWTDVQVAS